MLAIFEWKVTSELVNVWQCHPSEAAKVARCAAADWSASDDWKARVIMAIERSAEIASVFLLVVLTDDGWRTIEVPGNQTPWLELMSKYQKWMTRPFAVLPASELLSFVYKRCKEISSQHQTTGIEDCSRASVRTGTEGDQTGFAARLEVAATLAFPDGSMTASPAFSAAGRAAEGEGRARRAKAARPRRMARRRPVRDRGDRDIAARRNG